MAHCAICNDTVETENAPILAMGGFGNPRYLCPCCSRDFDTATEGENFEIILESVERISKNMAATKPDKVTVETACEILELAGKRAAAIKDGSYDFSLDKNDEEETELSEEYVPDPEDEELDRQDEEKNAKFDKIFNVVAVVVFSVLGAYFVYKLLDMFLF